MFNSLTSRVGILKKFEGLSLCLWLKSLDQQDRLGGVF